MSYFSIFENSEFLSLLKPVPETLRARLVISEGGKFIRTPSVSIFPSSMFNADNIVKYFSGSQYGAIHIEDLPENPDWAALHYILGRVRGIDVASTITKQAKQKLQDNMSGFITHFKSIHSNEEVAFERAFQFYLIILHMNETE